MAFFVSTSTSERFVGTPEDETDLVSYQNSIRGVEIDLTRGVSWDGAFQDTLISIENVIGSDHDDVIYGTSGSNVLDGGRSGIDFILGGDGLDFVSYAFSIRPVSVYLYDGNSFDGISQDFLNSMENVFGSAFDDQIYGDIGDNILDGGAGGADYLDGQGGSDTVSFIASTASGVEIDLSRGLAWDGTSVDTLVSIENALGSDGSDVIYGNSQNNIIDGGTGGVDFIFGGNGNDTVSYLASLTGVTVDLGAQTGFDGISVDFLDSIERAIGSSFDDTIVGSSGADRMNGWSGNDALFGYGGADIFQFRTEDGSAIGNDVVGDFQSGIDKIGIDSRIATSFADVMARSRQDGNDLIIDLGDNSSIIMVGQTASSVTQDDFIFI